MAIELAGQNALVTGASRGIGKAVAEGLARAGMRVALMARSEAALAALADTLRAEGGEAIPVPCDLNDSSAIEPAVKACCDALGGRIDVLVNNAGVFLETSVPDTDPADWDRVIQVNLTAPFLLCRAVLPLMRAQRSGRIVNIGSTSGMKGHVHQSAYCASKHGLVGFSRALAMEAKPYNVRVHCLCPGGVNTEFIAGSLVAERIEGEAVLEPEDVTELVLFVLRQPGNVDYPEVTVQRFHIG